MHPAIQEIRAAIERLPDVRASGRKAVAAGPEARRVADAAVKGTVYFYGDQPVDVGLESIDWSGSHVKHQEWPAQLNRFFHIAPLAACYAESKDETYARAARAYMEDWIAQRPPIAADAPGWPGDSSLNMTIRLGCLRGGLGWIRTLECFYGAAAFDDAFVDKVLESIDWQLPWLKHHLTSRGNWRIAGLCGLMEAALLLPSRYGAYLAVARNELLNECECQILPDGSHEERSAGYHEWMVSTFVTLRDIGLALGPDGWSVPVDRLVMGDYCSLAHTKPNGAPSRFNDGGGALTTKPGEDLIGKRLAAHKALRARLGRTDEPPVDGIFPDAGLAFFRTGWGPEDSWLGFDACTEWGGGHLHLSRLSLEYHHGGRTLLPDPGIFSYEMSTWYGPAGKKTPTHSTFNVDMLSQSDTGAKFLHAKADADWAFAHGCYENAYWSGRFDWHYHCEHGTGVAGVHDRSVLWRKDRFIAVLDFFLSDCGHTPYSHWALDAGPCAHSEDGLTVWTENEDANVLLRMIPIDKREDEGDLTLYRGDTEKELGYIARSHDAPEPAPLVSWAFKGHGCECVTLIVPFKDKRPEFEARAAICPCPRTAQRTLTIDWADGASDDVAWTFRLDRGLGTHILRDREHYSRSLLVATSRDADGTERGFEVEG